MHGFVFFNHPAFQAPLRGRGIRKKDHKSEIGFRDVSFLDNFGSRNLSINFGSTVTIGFWVILFFIIFYWEY